MTSVSEMLGMDKKIKEILESYDLADSKALFDFKQDVQATIDSLVADVYSNMKEIEKFKYKLIEMETKLDNLAAFCRGMHNREGK